MWTLLAIYLLFGLGITVSSKTSLVWCKPWYWQVLNVIAYPVLIYMTIVNTARVVVKMVEMQDDFVTKKEMPRRQHPFKIEVEDMTGTEKYDVAVIEKGDCVITRKEAKLAANSIEEYIGYVAQNTDSSTAFFRIINEKLHDDLTQLVKKLREHE